MTTDTEVLNGVLKYHQIPKDQETQKLFENLSQKENNKNKKLHSTLKFLHRICNQLFTQAMS